MTGIWQEVMEAIWRSPQEMIFKQTNKKKGIWGQTYRVWA